MEPASPSSKPGTSDLPPFRALPFLILTALMGLSAAGIWSLGWWRQSPERPDLSTLKDRTSQNAVLDSEQDAFRSRPSTEPEPEVEPLTEIESPDGETGNPLTSRDWIDRLAGLWVLDLGQGPQRVRLGSDIVLKIHRTDWTLELFPTGGGGVPPYYTVFENPEGSAFLLFRSEDNSASLLLDDLQEHGDQLISFRLQGTSKRSYGHRLQRSGFYDSEPLSPFSTPRISRVNPRDRPPSPMERRTRPGLWSQAERLRDLGRFESLEDMLDRILRIDPGHAEAREWKSQLPRWRQEQRQNLVSALGDHLDDLSRAVERGRWGDVSRLFIRSAGTSSRRFLQRHFRNSQGRKARFQIRSLELEDGVLRFDAVLTLESEETNHKSIQTIRWRGRFFDGSFLDPLGL